MPLIGFIKPPSLPLLPPGLPIRPPGPPNGPAGLLGSSLAPGAVGRLATRSPAGALLVGIGLVIGWAISNWRKPPVQVGPPTPGTSVEWKVTQGTGTGWYAMVTGYSSIYPLGWDANIPGYGYAENGDPIGDWLSWGPQSAVIMQTIVTPRPDYPPGHSQLGVVFSSRGANGRVATFGMGAVGKSFKVELYPRTFTPQPGDPEQYPNIPAPYQPQTPIPDKDKREKPKPAPPPATPKPLKPAQPKRTDPTPGPGDPAREQPPAQPPATPRPAAPPGLDEQIPGLRRELGAIRDALAKATSGQGAGGQGADPQGAKKGAATWAPTQPNGAPAPEPAPAPAKATDPTQHLTKAGPVTAPDVRPDLPSIAQEVGRIERKIAGMMGPQGIDLGSLLYLLQTIYDLLTNHVDGTQYTVTAACTIAGEEEPRSATVEVPGGLTREEAAIARLDAIAALMAEAQLLKQASCNGRNTTSPTNNVTITAYEVMQE